MKSALKNKWENRKQEVAEKHNGFTTSKTQAGESTTEKMCFYTKRGLFYAKIGVNNQRIKYYKTEVSVVNDSDFTVIFKKKVYSFKKTDVANYQLKLTPSLRVINVIDIISYILCVAIFCYQPMLGIAAVVAIFSECLMNTLKINLKNGKSIKVYYKNKRDAIYLAEKFL